RPERSCPERGPSQPAASATKGGAEASTKLPQVVPARGSHKASEATAAAIYSQSFKQVSTDAADKRRLYRSSQSLPAIKVKQRSQPDLPSRKWRPPC
ncbi:unnamed protein product, partial [Symbiodinium pilosum]